jgi:hypothetical protein
MGEVNSRNGSLMVTYGTLINVHRETDFVNKDGKKVFIDDDIDVWGHHLLLSDMYFNWNQNCFAGLDGRCARS